MVIHCILFTTCHSPRTAHSRNYEIISHWPLLPPVVACLQQEGEWRRSSRWRRAARRNQPGGHNPGSAGASFSYPARESTCTRQRDQWGCGGNHQPTENHRQHAYTRDKTQPKRAPPRITKAVLSCLKEKVTAKLTMAITTVRQSKSVA